MLFMKSPNNNARLLASADEFLRSRFVYADESIETLQHPEYMLNGLEMSGRLVGDCDDISTLHSALLTCMGFKTRFVAIRSTFADPNYDHVYIEANNDGAWIPYDITLPLGAKIEWFARLTIAV